MVLIEQSNGEGERNPAGVLRLPLPPAAWRGRRGAGGGRDMEDSGNMATDGDEGGVADTAHHGGLPQHADTTEGAFRKADGRLHGQHHAAPGGRTHDGRAVPEKTERRTGDALRQRSGPAAGGDVLLHAANEHDGDNRTGEEQWLHPGTGSPGTLSVHGPEGLPTMEGARRAVPAEHPVAGGGLRTGGDAQGGMAAEGEHVRPVRHRHAQHGTGGTLPGK